MEGPFNYELIITSLCMLFKVVLTFESVDKQLIRGHSNDESSCKMYMKISLSRGTICHAACCENQRCDHSYENC